MRGKRLNLINRRANTPRDCIDDIENRQSAISVYEGVHSCATIRDASEVVPLQRVLIISERREPAKRVCDVIKSWSWVQKSQSISAMASASAWSWRRQAGCAGHPTRRELGGSAPTPRGLGSGMRRGAPGWWSRTPEPTAGAVPEWASGHI